MVFRIANMFDKPNPTAKIDVLRLRVRGLYIFDENGLPAVSGLRKVPHKR